MWTEYFILFGLLLLFYCVARIGMSEMLLLPSQRRPKERHDDRPGTPIDASTLTERVVQVRKNHTGELPAAQNSFKKPLLVESRREEIAKLAYFNHPPPHDEPPDREDHLAMLMV